MLDYCVRVSSLMYLSGIRGLEDHKLTNFFFLNSGRQVVHKYKGFNLCSGIDLFIYCSFLQSKSSLTENAW